MASLFILGSEENINHFAGARRCEVPSQIARGQVADHRTPAILARTASPPVSPGVVDLVGCGCADCASIGVRRVHGTAHEGPPHRLRCLRLRSCQLSTTRRAAAGASRIQTQVREPDLGCITLVTTRGEGVEDPLRVIGDLWRGGDLLSAEADRR